MLTVTPSDPNITVSKVNCSPKCSAGIWGHKGGSHLKITSNEDGTVSIGPVPERLANGVYNLVITTKNGDCCHSMKVNVLMHDTPTIPMTHTPTDPNEGETIMEECTVDSNGKVHIEEAY